MVILEVCAEGLQGLHGARRAGASRVELCAGLGEGGTTASAGLLARAARVAGIELVALVRPRPGGFVYDADERAVMEHDVGLARELGLAGVALGGLTAEGRVDEALVGALLERARPLRVTFHRAFDWTRDPFEALETLVQLGVDRVLSSGQAPSAFEGRERLRQLVTRARGRLTVVAAGGVRAEHASELVRASGTDELHLSAARPWRDPAARRPPGTSLASRARALEPDEQRVTDADEIERVRQALGAQG